jgi:hypothetical protein
MLDHFVAGFRASNGHDDISDVVLLKPGDRVIHERCVMNTKHLLGAWSASAVKSRCCKLIGSVTCRSRSPARSLGKQEMSCRYKAVGGAGNIRRVNTIPQTSFIKQRLWQAPAVRTRVPEARLCHTDLPLSMKLSSDKLSRRILSGETFDPGTWCVQVKLNTAAYKVPPIDPPKLVVVDPFSGLKGMCAMLDELGWAGGYSYVPSDIVAPKDDRHPEHPTIVKDIHQWGEEEYKNTIMARTGFVTNPDCDCESPIPGMWKEFAVNHCVLMVLGVCCEAYSQARNRYFPTEEEMVLSDKKLRKGLDLARALGSNGMRVLILIENGEDTRLWARQIIKDAVEEFDLRFHVIDLCQYGATYQKSTGLLMSAKLAATFHPAKCPRNLQCTSIREDWAGGSFTHATRVQDISGVAGIHFRCAEPC